MKNYLLIITAICLITISSLYSVSAIYHGTFSVQVGQSPTVQVGLSPTVTITNGSSISSNGGGTSSNSNGGSAGGGSDSATTVNFNTTGASFAINPTPNSLSNSNALVLSNNNTNQNPSGITSSVIDTITSPAGVGVIGSLALVAGIAVIAVSRRNNKLHHK